MPKGTTAHEYRKRTADELVTELRKLREELQTIRFTKVSGTAVQKLSKIKTLRRQIARLLTLIRENKRNAVVSKLRTRTSTEGTGDQAKTIETTIKNLKFKHIPLDLRPKRTRAIRRRLTKFESKLVTLRQFKRRLNFPVRRFAVPLH